jgi:hypothetical protein
LQTIDVVEKCKDATWNCRQFLSLNNDHAGFLSGRLTVRHYMGFKNLPHKASQRELRPAFQVAAVANQFPP